MTVRRRLSGVRSPSDDRKPHLPRAPRRRVRAVLRGSRGPRARPGPEGRASGRPGVGRPEACRPVRRTAPLRSARCGREHLTTPCVSWSHGPGARRPGAGSAGPPEPAPGRAGAGRPRTPRTPLRSPPLPPPTDRPGRAVRTSGSGCRKSMIHSAEDGPQQANLLTGTNRGYSHPSDESDPLPGANSDYPGRNC